MPSRVGRPALAIGAIALAGLLAMPALAQELSPSPSDDPSASPSPSASTSESPSTTPETSPSPATSPSTEPSATTAPVTVTPSAPTPAATGAPSPAGASDGDGDEDAPPITLTGIVGATADDKHPEYTLTVGSLVYRLETGPWWFWGDAHPLAPFVGKAVTIRGEADGTDGIEVFSANGTTIREPGKPPWAGGPFVVGERHPGWKPWMADGKPGKGPKTPETTP